MKSIMYHYVREYSPSLPYFKFLDVKDFSKQLDYFEREYGFLSKSDFDACIRSGKTEKGVVLTFDDAFRDHYEFVFPELVKRGLWAIFYVPTGPYESGKILDVHRVHLILGKIGADEVFQLLSQIVSNQMLRDKVREEFRDSTYSTQRDNQFNTSVKVKRILNYYLDYQYREDVINQLMDMAFPGLDKPAHDDVYMSVSQMREMSDAGMVIGSHTVSHPVLSKLDDAAQTTEITESFEFLKRNVGNCIDSTFCYPHGGFHTFTSFTESLLNEIGVQYSFNVEARDVNDDDLTSRPQALPRYDCNLFPHGQAS